MNETIRKFGHPATLVRDYAHWVVLVRPAQPTLGSLVLAAKSDATAFGDLPEAAHTELAVASRDIEAVLQTLVGYDRINYLMLMMVDPHVHFHVIPRYEGARQRGGLALPDQGWPKTPDLGSGVTLDAAQIADLAAWLKAAWPN
ncbi:diadenosine tetraphosphate (Ap4A) HIT family hydrolase [Sphingomonas sp. F9_3S_D5_B_2]